MALDTTHAIIFLGLGGKVSDLTADPDGLADAEEFIDNVQHDEVGVSQNVDSFHVYVSASYETGNDLNGALEALAARVTAVE